MIKPLGLVMLAIGIAVATAACDRIGSRTQAQQTVPHTDTSARELILDLGSGAAMQLVRVPAGKFLMGSPEAEKHRAPDEVQHQVAITNSFYMGAKPVTVSQFTVFVKDSGYVTDAERDGWSESIAVGDGRLVFKRVNHCSWRNPSFSQKGDHPVVQVSWNDAHAFCAWLSKKTGKAVELPTEAQWEYACRAGTTTAYPWGDNPDDGKGWANGADQSLRKRFPNAPGAGDLFGWDDGFEFTSPVGSFKANAFGLYDMNGNVLQWCQDPYGDYMEGNATDPMAVEDGGPRVLRGGSWASSPMYCRSARRGKLNPCARNDTCGFRVAIVATPAPSTRPVAPPATSPAPSTQPVTLLTLVLGDRVTMRMVRIPTGKFLMGTPEGEKYRVNDESQHEVTISQPFFMGMTHVTVDQFAAFVKDSGYRTDAEKAGWSTSIEVRDGSLDMNKVDGCSWRNPGFGQKGDHPVVQVSWNDAHAFCAWLSKKTGKAVELPTEAQWEYACRAGTTTAYPWGDNPDDGKGWANGADQSFKKKLVNGPPDKALFGWDDGFVFTSPVGSFKANAFGLYDMNGNALQWCRDRYGEYAVGAVTDPTGAKFGDLRVLRGGTWDSPPWYCRSAFRSCGERDDRLNTIGFRVVVVAVAGWN